MGNQNIKYKYEKSIDNAYFNKIEPTNPSHSRIYLNNAVKRLEVVYNFDLDDVRSIFMDGFRRNKGYNLINYRNDVNLEVPVKINDMISKTWDLTKFGLSKLGLFIPITYDGFAEIVTEYTVALNKLDLVKTRTIDDTELRPFGYFACNSHEYLAMDIACMYLGYTNVPLNPLFSCQHIANCIMDVQAEVIYVDIINLKKLKSVIKRYLQRNALKVKYLIIKGFNFLEPYDTEDKLKVFKTQVEKEKQGFDKIDQKDPSTWTDEEKAIHSHLKSKYEFVEYFTDLRIKLISLDYLHEKANEKYKIVDKNPNLMPSLPQIPRDAITLVMFTAGTTGRPKSCIFTNTQIMAAINNYQNILKEFNFKNTKNPLSTNYYNVYSSFSYIPYSDFNGRVADYLAFLNNGSIVYPDQRRNFIEELSVFKPSVLFCNAHMLKELHDKLKQRVCSYNNINQSTFYTHYKNVLDRYLDTGEVYHNVLEKTIFLDLKNELGGLISAIVAINPTITETALDFLKCGLGTNIITTYSLTEALGAVAVSNNINPRADITGYIVSHTTMKFSYEKLLNKKELLLEDNEAHKLSEKYFWSEDNKYEPKGEIYLKGPTIMLKYLNDDYNNFESFSKEWFKTGDIGMVRDNKFYYLDRAIYISRNIDEQIMYPSYVAKYVLSCHLIKYCYVYVNSFNQDPVCLLDIDLDQVSIMKELPEDVIYKINNLHNDNSVKEFISGQLKNNVVESSLDTNLKVKRYLLCNGKYSRDKGVNMHGISDVKYGLENFSNELLKVFNGKGYDILIVR